MNLREDLNQSSKDFRLNVYITHFVPPKKSMKSNLYYFINSRCNISYLRSWARLVKHGTRGNQPWKKDVMTQIRRKDQKNRNLYLIRVLQAIIDLRTKETIVNIVTNSDSAKREILEFGFTAPVKIHVFEKYNKMNPINNSPWEENDVLSPWNLVWEHKNILKKNLLTSSSNDLFLYLENDILFTQENLDYYLSNKDILNQHGLFPAFMRVEYDHRENKWVAMDQFYNDRLSISKCPNIKIDDVNYVQLPNTYCAMYILDNKTAGEYVQSDAFDMEKSRAYVWWDKGARASMGLQFTNIPKNFDSRNVVKVIDSKIVSGALIHHLPNLYCRRFQKNRTFLNSENLFLDE